MLFRETIDLYFENYTKHTKAFRGQNSEVVETETARLYELNFPMVGLALGVPAAVIKCGFVVQAVITVASGHSSSARSGEDNYTSRHKYVLFGGRLFSKLHNK
jgi:hypothetical protein